jgi:hypothetical protein
MVLIELDPGVVERYLCGRHCGQAQEITHWHQAIAYRVASV